MQVEPYPEKNGARVWLSSRETKSLLDTVDSDPRHELAIRLGLHGLRSDEILRVATDHVRPLQTDAEAYKLLVPDGKSGRRECPLRADCVRLLNRIANMAGTRKDQPVLDVSATSTIRNWVNNATDELIAENENWEYVSPHDLRRTWATSVYYQLAVGGTSPDLAKELVMSWGGWAKTPKGRQTFSQNYLGNEPDHVAATLMADAELL